MAESARGSTGYTEEEAREFHRGYVNGTIGFIIVAIIAHWLTWGWKPWLV